jgi:hypothetical protein
LQLTFHARLAVFTGNKEIAFKMLLVYLADRQRWRELGLVIQPLFMEIDATFPLVKRYFFSEDHDNWSFSV